MKYYRIASIVVIIILLCANIIQYRNSKELIRNVPYSDRDRAIIDRSIELYAKDTGMNQSDVLNVRFAVVTSGLNDQRCVNLRLPRDAIGFIQVFCFDSDERLIYRDKI